MVRNASPQSKKTGNALLIDVDTDHVVAKVSKAGTCRKPACSRPGGRFFASSSFAELTRRASTTAASGGSPL